MSSEYRHNHYVPVWYQKRFLPAGRRDNELFYLNLKPPTATDSQGRVHSWRAVRRLGFRHCFATRDLYTTRFGAEESTKIEQMFFGEIDSKGRAAVGYWTNFAHPSVNGDAFNDVMMYMSTQKLRTPKGLGWLSSRVRTADRNAVLQQMVTLRQLHCAIWTECIWAIADCEKSETKLIVSDHPVTVYNRRCGPRSQWCRGYEDPDINLHATHTIFPLTLEKVLILTNLSWVRNPYQSEVAVRPNAHPWRRAMFNFMEVQTLRHLTEREVREINFIIKSRALQYVAAANEEWLYPEKHVSKSDWNVFGDGYLLMPDPRPVTFSGEITIGFADGRATSFDAYGRRPWQRDFGREYKSMDEWDTLQRFKGEFARLCGPYRRGRSFAHAIVEPERDDDDYHRYHLGLEAKYRRRK
jgi:Protein of unknown function (DUF4238)